MFDDLLLFSRVSGLLFVVQVNVYFHREREIYLNC